MSRHRSVHVPDGVSYTVYPQSKSSGGVLLPTRPPQVSSGRQGQTPAKRATCPLVDVSILCEQQVPPAVFLLL